MLYISLEYILSSIQQLKNVHTFIGITFLTCKKNNLPIETPVTFPMDNNTKLFMDDVHKICPSSSHYFQPYQTNAKKQWLAPKYPSAGLQAINTQTFMIEMENIGHGPKIMFNEFRKLLFQNLRRECLFSLWLFGL